MKRIAIFAMLAVFVLLATPLLTTSAMAETVEDPIVVDTTGADWDYRVYGDANGNIFMVKSNFGQDDELQDFTDWDYRVYGDVIGGEWYGDVIDGEWHMFHNPHVDFIQPDTTPGSLHIILTSGPYGNIEVVATGNLYEEV